jgi:hypothetical protein
MKIAYYDHLSQSNFWTDKELYRNWLYKKMAERNYAIVSWHRESRETGVGPFHTAKNLCDSCRDCGCSAIVGNFEPPLQEIITRCTIYLEKHHCDSTKYSCISPYVASDFSGTVLFCNVGFLADIPEILMPAYDLSLDGLMKDKNGGFQIEHENFSIPCNEKPEPVSIALV